MRRSASPSIRGFTVVEMLVVLMITGMALALGFQSLAQWQRAEETLQKVLADNRSSSLTAHWWQDSVRAATPTEEIAFRGEANYIRLMSLAPVFASQGGATPMEWKIVNEGSQAFLELKEFDREIRLPIRNARSAEFHYVGLDGRRSQQWPPELTSSPTHLPVGVQMTVNTADNQEQHWVVHIVGPLDPPFNAFKFRDEI